MSDDRTPRREDILRAADAIKDDYRYQDLRDARILLRGFEAQSRALKKLLDETLGHPDIGDAHFWGTRTSSFMNDILEGIERLDSTLRQAREAYDVRQEKIRQATAEAEAVLEPEDD